MNRSEIKKLIVSARNHRTRANIETAVLFTKLTNDIAVDLEDIPNNSAENANNLSEAILCHINYGECDLEELLDDIMNAKKKYASGGVVISNEG